MRQRIGVSTAIWGLLSILAGALMTEGGVMEVVAYGAQGLATNVAVGALGAVASRTAVVGAVGSSFTLGTGIDPLLLAR